MPPPTATTSPKTKEKKMKKITITVEDKLAVTITQLLMDEAVDFTVESAGIHASDIPYIKERKRKKPSNFGLTSTNRGLIAVLQAGTKAPAGIFFPDDVKRELEVMGLAPNGYSAGISRAIKRGICTRGVNSSTWMLTDKGKALATKLLVVNEAA